MYCNVLIAVGRLCSNRRMDEQVVRMAVEDVMKDLGIGDRRFEIESAMAAPNSDSFQVRVYDDSGDHKSVVVNLRDEDGVTIYLDEIRGRVRKQLETIAEITRGGG